MAAYFVAELTVIDPDLFERYKPLAEAAIKSMGGEYIVRGGDRSVVEGTVAGSRTVILKFENVDAIHQWYNSDVYAPALKMRLESTIATAYIVDGL